MLSRFSPRPNGDPTPCATGFHEKFQSQKTRLKAGPQNRAQNAVHFVSISQDTIKGLRSSIRKAEAVTFQSHNTRLKIYPSEDLSIRRFLPARRRVSIPEDTIKRSENHSFSQATPRFQSQKTRLKARIPPFIRCPETNVSIPEGTIKSAGRNRRRVQKSRLSIPESTIKGPTDHDHALPVMLVSILQSTIKCRPGGLHK